MTDRVGQELGNYRLLRLLGRGGFAEVYLGEHLRLKTQAAIKVLHVSLKDDDVEGILREAQMVARLKHPHIVRVFDFDIEDHTPFLVMDCLPNGSVRHSHPRGTPLPLSTILSYVKQVASALQYAHDEKLIHRDVKPENMLLDKGDTIMLSDFGIALMAQSSLYQNTQEVAGTAAYMAPEQFQGKPRRASDQYALGVVVYEWLSGDRPFHGSFSEIASQHLFVPPPPLDKKVPTITPEVEQVVLMALEKDPHKRFASVQEFATVLEQACQSATTHPATLLSKGTPRKWPSPPANTAVEIPSSQSPQPKNAAALRKQPLHSTNVVTLPNRSSQSTGAVTPSSTPTVMHSSTGESMLTDKSRRSPGHFTRRTVVGGLVGVAGLVIVGGGLTWLAGSHSSFSPAAIPSPIPTSKSTPTLATSPTPIPLGTSLLIYRGHSDWVGIVGWSHDGEHIASGSADKTVQVWDAATGTHVYTYRGHSGYIFALAWSPDGKRIASGGADQEVQVWDATTGGHILTHSYWAEANGVSWSPVGKRIASGGPDPIVPVRNVVQVWDAVSGDNILTYHGHSGSLFAVAWSPDGKHIASGSAVPTVLVWDAVTGDTIYTYRGHFSTVCAVAWSPDSKRIASGGIDQTVQVWDAVTGTHVYTYRGHSNVVRSVMWSPNGMRIVSAGDDGTVQVWDAATGNNVYTYYGHSGQLSAVAWSPDGTRIASGGADKTVQVWQAI